MKTSSSRIFKSKVGKISRCHLTARRLQHVSLHTCLTACQHLHAAFHSKASFWTFLCAICSQQRYSVSSQRGVAVHCGSEILFSPGTEAERKWAGVILREAAPRRIRHDEMENSRAALGPRRRVSELHLPPSGWHVKNSISYSAQNIFIHKHKWHILANSGSKKHHLFKDKD